MRTAHAEMEAHAYQVSGLQRAAAAATSALAKLMPAMPLPRLLRLRSVMFTLPGEQRYSDDRPHSKPQHAGAEGQKNIVHGSHIVPLEDALLNTVRDYSVTGFVA